MWRTRHEMETSGTKWLPKGGQREPKWSQRGAKRRKGVPNGAYGREYRFLMPKGVSAGELLVVICDFLDEPDRSKGRFWSPAGCRRVSKIDMVRLARNLGGPRWAKSSSRGGSRNGSENGARNGAGNEGFWRGSTLKSRAAVCMRCVLSKNEASRKGSRKWTKTRAKTDSKIIVDAERHRRTP